MKVMSERALHFNALNEISLLFVSWEPFPVTAPTFSVQYFSFPLPQKVMYSQLSKGTERFPIEANDSSKE
jgi:hypothetical protein